MDELAAGGGKDVRRRFFAALVRSRLIVPSPGLAASGLQMNAGPQRADNAKINLVGVEAPDGTKGLIVFTTEQALQKWRPVGCPYVEVVGAQVVQMALRSGLKSVVVNANGPTRGLISQAELFALAEGSDATEPKAPRKLPPGSIRLHPLSTPLSSELTETVTSSAAGLPQIRAIWILDATVRNAPPRRIVLVEHAPGVDHASDVATLMTSFQKRLAPGEFVDCMPLASGDALLGMAADVGPPVFSRGESSSR